MATATYVQELLFIQPSDLPDYVKNLPSLPTLEELDEFYNVYVRRVYGEDLDPLVALLGVKISAFFVLLLQRRINELYANKN